MRHLLYISCLLACHFAQAQEKPIVGDRHIYADFDGEMVVLGGCSWYCGGNAKATSSSSSLSANGTRNYKSGNAHDFDINTAWVEGVDGHGIGEWLEYEFDLTHQPEHQIGITKIYIANGYRKSKSLWEKNGRVKTLKVYLDGVYFITLELLDAFEFQEISIPKIMLPQEKILKIRFEIAAVYPGSKYQDTCISELLFDGVGVH